MQIFLFSLLFCLAVVQLSARTDTIPRFSTPSYFALIRDGAWEESHVVRNLPPCRVVGLRIFYQSKLPGSDTIHFSSTSRLTPFAPMSEYWSRAGLSFPVVVDITRDSQTVDIDLRSRNIVLAGYEAFILSHKTNTGDMFWSTRTSSSIFSPLDTVSYSVAIDRNSAKPKIFPVSQKFAIQIIVEHDYEIHAVRVQPQSGSMLAEYNEIAAWEYGSNNASVVDIDGDGFDDVMFDSLMTLNRNAGTLELRAVTVQPANSRFGADISAWADIDRDGDLDCIIHDHETQALRLLRTDSLHHFTDITTASGISGGGAINVLLWFDAENDGDPDFFVGRDEQDMLWLNDGSGKFTEATISSGLADAEPAPYDICGSASLGDINGDGFTDLMVVTRGDQPDRLFVNNGSGKFTVINTPGRIGSLVAGSHGNGEGAEWGDFNNDGLTDILVANSIRVDNPDPLQDASIVWRNRSVSALTFDTIWTNVGLPFVGSTNGYTSADINLDGLQDFACVVPDTQLSIQDRAFISILTQRVVNGRRSYSRDAFAFGLPVIDVGFALRTDIDMDGDPDFIVNRTAVLRNNQSNTNNGISIRLRNDSRPAVTKDCFGSHVSVFAGTTAKRIFFPGTISTGRGSCNSAVMTFGLGTNVKADSIVVKYSDNSSSTFRNIAANGAYVLNTSGTIVRIAGAPRQQQPLFNAVEVSTQPQFAWSDMGAGVTYDVQVSKLPSFNRLVYSRSGIANTTHTTETAIPNSTEYVWRLRAHFANGTTSQWSTAWPMTVGKVIPSGLFLFSPPDGENIYLPEVQLRWTHQNDSRQINALSEYRIQVAKDTSFASALIDTVVDNLESTVRDILPATTLYWRVQPIQSGVNGIWSETWKFSTKAFPGRIEQIAPYNGETNVLSKVQLRWRKPAGLDASFLATYVMHFALDSLCLDILDTGTTPDTIEIGQYLLLNQKYYWRVRLVTGFGFGPWSDIWWFKTGFTISDVSEDVQTGARTTSLQMYCRSQRVHQTSSASSSEQTCRVDLRLFAAGLPLFCSPAS